MLKYRIILFKEKRYISSYSHSKRRNNRKIKMERMEVGYLNLDFQLKIARKKCSSRLFEGKTYIFNLW